MRVACIFFPRSVPTSKIAELFLRFSPQICLRGDRAIFVEVGKCNALYSESSFIARAQVLLRKFGHTAKIQIASDITDALTLTMYGKEKIEDLPLTSLVEFADPFDRDPVLRKSVQELIISFRDLGIKSIGQFKKISASELISRFGIIGRHCHSRVHLAEKILWPQWVPEEITQEKKEFPYFEFYGELDPILFELKTQLDRIFSRLFSRGKRATKLEVQIKCEKISTHPNHIRTLEFAFFTPQSAVKGALRIFKERLAREFEKHPVLSPIEAIQTTVIATAESSSRQKNIFNSDEEKEELIQSIHNQLIELLGKENVYQANLTQDRRPEKSWTKYHGSPHEESKVPFDLLRLIPERPTYLCRHPLKIQVMAGFIFIKKKRYRILNWDSQVERLTGGWFEKPNQEIENTFNRNYYHVEIEGHQRITVFETPDREFFLHGYYG